jgi:hypothetical protein
MQKTPEEQALPKQPQVIKPVSVNCAGETVTADLEGYAVHTGEARSTEDVTVRRGTAPIIERGEADDDEIEARLTEIETDSGGAPD